jgi:DNA-binding response OmpR family regulator
VSELQILFVDSDPLSQKRFLRALQDRFSIWCVSSVAEAKRQLALSLPDMVIAEVRFNAQESGLELCCYIRSVPSLRHLPIMLLTAFATVPDKVAGFEAGADDYVVKPFDSRHMIARIRLLARIKHFEQREENAENP